MVGTRILAGRFKGRSHGALPKDIFARPILARIKKSLFDILSPRLPGCKFLDLFAGSGSVGLEALSRGAQKVVMVDRNPKAVQWIKGSIRELQGSDPSLPQKVIVHNADVLKGLSWLNDSFDIVFSGAPYKDEKRKPLYFVTDLFNLIENGNLLNPDGWFVAQHHDKETFVVPSGWTHFRTKEYGDTTISFFKKDKLGV